MTQPYLGQIAMFGGNFAPLGWALCNGQLLDIAQNNALYQLLGTTYGGNGTTTFALPDLQCRLPVHQGTGTGLSTYVLGQKAGSEKIALQTSEMPSHSHPFNVTAAPATSTTIGGSLLPAMPTTGTTATGNTAPEFYTSPSGTPNIQSMAAGSCGAAGQSVPHANQMPSLCITFVIALQGIYPSP
jgi:microcystin-dependent protein